MRLAELIESLQALQRAHGDIEVVRRSEQWPVQKHPGPELAYRHALYPGRLTAVECHRGELVCKI